MTTGRGRPSVENRVMMISAGLAERGDASAAKEEREAHHALHGEVAKMAARPVICLDPEASLAQAKLIDRACGNDPAHRKTWLPKVDGRCYQLLPGSKERRYHRAPQK